MFSSRCPHCIADTGVLFLWITNFGGWLLALVFFILLGWVIFG